MGDAQDYGTQVMGCCGLSLDVDRGEDKWRTGAVDG